MARVLLVGCGCRGRALAAALVADRHLVRGTSRTSAGAASIEAAGLDAVIADPDRLGTLLPALEGVSAAAWLMATASGEGSEALHGSRLESFLDTLVDTAVRGFVYEGGPGAAIVERAAATHRMPARVVGADPRDHETWLAAMRGAVADVVGGRD